MISYSLLKTRSTRKKFNAPLPNPTNKQSINPASFEVNATPIAVATAIKIYMNHFSFLFIIQLGCLDDYFLSYAKPRPQNTMNRGSLKSPFSIAVVRVIPKRTANERIPINLHLGSTLFFLNQSSIDIWIITLYTKSNNQ